MKLRGPVAVDSIFWTRCFGPMRSRRIAPGPDRGLSGSLGLFVVQRGIFLGGEWEQRLRGNVASTSKPSLIHQNPSCMPGLTEEGERRGLAGTSCQPPVDGSNCQLVEKHGCN